jgi:hypothetical protein
MTWRAISVRLYLLLLLLQLVLLLLLLLLLLLRRGLLLRSGLLLLRRERLLLLLLLLANLGLRDFPVGVQKGETSSARAPNANDEARVKTAPGR